MPDPKSPATQEIENIIAQIPDMKTNDRYALLVELIMKGSRRCLKNETTNKPTKGHDKDDITAAP